MLAAATAGVVYFAVVLAIGVVLGIARVGGLVPWLGPTGAVLLEIPIILAASWAVCRRLIAAFGVPAAPAERLVMGGLAFALLMLAELALSMTLYGRSLAQHIASYSGLPNVLGLLAQIVFALMPLVALRTRLTRRPPPEDR